ncbi:MAG: ribonucleoside-diphosphate reductase [Proteobacteria bacterium]|nr:ribonucleoside-diphosphate reductase [Pseudomonadota bacterium]
MEPLLQEEERRYSLFPIRYPKVWNLYKQAFAALWVPGEVDLSEDPKHWAKLTDQERHFLSHVLAFFATSDGIVCDNLAEHFTQEVTIREVRCFYDLQKTMENVHNEMYSLLIDTLVQDPIEQQRLFNAIEEIPCVSKKAKWAQRWMNSSESFPTRLIAFCIVEGVFFSGSFAAIFWMKKRGLLPGLCVSNTLIARDERMHQDFAAFLYKDIVVQKLDAARIHEIMSDAVDHEIEFVCDAIPVSLIGMNSADMCDYIKFVADRLLVQLGVEKLYHTANPFDWAVMQGMENKTNFFEARVSEYQKTGVRNEDGHTFALDDEF